MSASEWIGVTTNSEECSYSSESINTDSQDELNNNDQTVWENVFGPTTILSPSCVSPSDLGNTNLCMCVRLHVRVRGSCVCAHSCVGMCVCVYILVNV